MPHLVGNWSLDHCVEKDTKIASRGRGCGGQGMRCAGEQAHVLKQKTEVDLWMKEALTLTTSRGARGGFMQSLCSYCG